LYKILKQVKIPAIFDAEKPPLPGFLFDVMNNIKNCLLYVAKKGFLCE
jgi:hypothetical protein